MEIETIPVGFLQANCYVVSDDNGAAAVIDPGDEPEKILTYLKENSLLCETILITHGHFDHVGGVRALLRATGAKLAISRLDEISVNDNIDIDVRDGMKIDAGRLSFEVIATPGHSPGGVCYLIEDSLFTGDTLFFGVAGRTDIPRADHEALLRSLRRLKNLPQCDLTVYPGHMQATTLKYEREHNPFLR